MISYLRKECVQGRVTSLNFEKQVVISRKRCEIEVAIEDIQEIVCGLSNSTFSDLEGHFCCLNLCVHPPRWFAS